MESKLFKIMDFRRNLGAATEARQNPLVVASMAMAEPSSRQRTGNLVSLLLTHAARSRRRSQPRSQVRLQVFSPNGQAATRLQV